jgi:hypothetical protein
MALANAINTVMAALSVVAAIVHVGSAMGVERLVLIDEAIRRAVQ